MVYSEEMDLPERARILRERVGLLLDPPFTIGDNHVKVTAGVGVAFAQPDDASAEDLIVRAEAAMRRAKRSPGSRSTSGPGKASRRLDRHGRVFADLLRSTARPCPSA
jgi:GGDEF domain-containing protein